MNRLAKLREVRVDRGATPAEAECAEAKAAEIESDKRRVDAETYLKNQEWPKIAAHAISRLIDLSEPLNVGNWRGDRAVLFRDWCSAHERNPSYLTSQLAYLSSDLRNVFHQFGSRLYGAKDAVEVARVFQEYLDR